MSRQKQVQLKKQVSPFAKTDSRKSTLQIINTFIPFFGLWFLAYQSLSVTIWLSLALSIIASGFLVRVFIIFHDCTHMSFFKSGKANRVLGTITGIMTHFPFEKWKREHAIHHATSGNLDKRGTGDIWVMTVSEYLNASWWRKLAYRLYRNPFILFGLGPFYLLLLSNRVNRIGAKRKERWNTYFINIVLVVIYALLIWAIGWQALLIIQLPIVYIAAALGIWLFYIQHQFEDSYFENEEDWDYVKAAVDGSSYYKLPKILQWVSGNIGFHHVHHLSPRVPNYNLEEAHETVPPLQKVTTITLLSSLKAIRFRLYDEATKSFINFKELQRIKKTKGQSSRPGLQLNLKKSAELQDKS